MLEKFLRRRAPINRLRSGLLGPHFDSFVATLSHLGYARETVQQRLRLLHALGRWLRRRSVVLVDLHEDVINLFLEKRRSSGRLQYGDAQAARDFLDHLRAKGVIRAPEPATDQSPLTTLRQQYANYLEKERGLTPATIPSTGATLGVSSLNALGMRRSVSAI